MNLIIFSLNAVARFPHPEIEKCMREALTEFGLKPNSNQHFPQDLNILQAFKAYCKKEHKVKIDEEQLELLVKYFSKKVKKLFLADDDLFEIRPGVQSLFGEIENQKGWKYGIISHLDANTSQFILQSCGVFSKGKLTLCAEEGPNYKEQISRLSKRVEKNSVVPKVHFFSLETEHNLAEETTLMLPEKSKKEKNYFTYRRFEEYFKKGKKNKKKKNK